MKINFSCHLMFRLKAREASVSDKDKYFYEGGTIFPNSIMELEVEPEDPLEVLIFISSKNLITEVGFISLNKSCEVQKASIEGCLDRDAYVCYSIQIH